MFKSFKLVENKAKLISVIFLAGIASLTESFGIAAFFPLLSILLDPNSENFLTIFFKEIFNDNAKVLLALFAGGLFIFAGIIKLISNWIIYKFIFELEANIGVIFLKQHLNQKYINLSGQSKSKVVSKLLGEISFIVNGSLLPSIMLIVQIISILFLLCILVLASNVASYLGILFIFFMYVFIYFGIKKILINSGRERVAANEAKYRIIDELNLNPRFIKVKALEKNYLERFKSFSMIFSIANAKAIVAGAAPRTIVEAILLALGVIIIFFLTKDDPKSLNEFIVQGGIIGLVLYKILPALQQSYKYLSQIHYNEKSLDEFLTLFKEKIKLNSSLPNNYQQIEYKTCEPLESISFNNISFSFNHVSIIEEYSESFKRGDFVALIGKTGSGKTTLIDLILGLFSEDFGEIKFNGRNLVSDERLKYASSFGLVTQESHLIPGSILENILLGNSKSNIDDDMLSYAIRFAELEDLINDLPNGLETIIGDGGQALSGGQKQRIAIARAIVSKPDVIIFDEGTSALDQSTQLKILYNLKEYSVDRIIFFITHNSEVIKFSNKIINFDSLKHNNENS